MHHGLVSMQRVLAGIHVHALGVGEPTRDHVERKQGDVVGAAVSNPLGVSEGVGHAHQDRAWLHGISGRKVQTHNNVAPQDFFSGKDFRPGFVVIGILVPGGQSRTNLHRHREASGLKLFQ